MPEKEEKERDPLGETEYYYLAITSSKNILPKVRPWCKVSVENKGPNDLNVATMNGELVALADGEKLEISFNKNIIKGLSLDSDNATVKIIAVR